MKCGVSEKINWSSVKRLAVIQCTHDEIALFLGISQTTLYKRCIKDNGVELKDFIDRSYSAGLVSLRRRLHRMALHSNKFAPLKFSLGNYLKMYDKTEVDVGNSDYERLTAEEQATFKRLAIAKAKKEIEELDV